MPELPSNAINPVLAAINEAILAANPPQFRSHLGASIIGHNCERYLWYSFRNSLETQYHPRLLRLFERGQLEEDRFIGWLRAAGIEVHEKDPDTGEQFKVIAVDGHFGGSMDGCAHKVPPSEKWHVLEMKTHNDKSFKQLQKKGVEISMPMHYSQMCIYMHLTGMERALYLAINKNDDDIYVERIKKNPGHSKNLLAKAERVIYSESPLAKMSEKADYFECKWCDYQYLCHGEMFPAINCRTCLHSTPEKDGTWSCAGGKEYGLKKCPKHLWIPPYFESHSDIMICEDNYVEYGHRSSGRKWKNKAGGVIIGWES